MRSWELNFRNVEYEVPEVNVEGERIDAVVSYDEVRKNLTLELSGIPSVKNVEVRFGTAMEMASTPGGSGIRDFKQGADFL